jgi:uncharacterized protein
MSDGDRPGHDMLLDEYRACLAKVDAKVAEVQDRRAADLACRAGCADCCAAGLEVLPVEAYAIEAHLAAQEPALPEPREGRCAFLDEDGLCAVYAARPLLCRSHGLPIRMPGNGGRGQLPVLDEDTWACGLNFVDRGPEPEDVLCGTTLMALLSTVDARFRDRAGLPAGTDRVSLSSIAGAWRRPS